MDHHRELILINILHESSSDEVEDESSSDEELEEEVMIFLNSNISQRRGTLRKIPRIKLYMELTIMKYNSNEFKSHFRMLPDTFEFVLGLINNKIMNTGEVAGNKPIEAKKQLLFALWMMATPDCYRSVCEKFDIGFATGVRTMRRVSKALHSLAPQFIQWPTGERATEVARDFERYSAFPGVVGAIDGTHIKIYGPSEDGQSYVNRKGVHSIQVQAVCTRQLLFTSIFAGYAGSVHDARVFRVSPVQKYIENEGTYFQGDTHLIGDAAYGIHPLLMVPFKNNGHLTRRDLNFNFCLSSARMSIERAFGLWKGRWRSIQECLAMRTINKIPEYLVATAVLHNICILKGDLIEYNRQLRVVSRGRLLNDRRQEGLSKRQRISANLVLRSI